MSTANRTTRRTNGAGHDGRFATQPVARFGSRVVTAFIGLLSKCLLFFKKQMTRPFTRNKVIYEIWLNQAKTNIVRLSYQSNKIPLYPVKQIAFFDNFFKVSVVEHDMLTGDLLFKVRLDSLDDSPGSLRLIAKQLVDNGASVIGHDEFNLLNRDSGANS